MIEKLSDEPGQNADRRILGISKSKQFNLVIWGNKFNTRISAIMDLKC